MASTEQTKLAKEKESLYRDYGKMYYEYQNLNDTLVRLEENIRSCRKQISEIDLKQNINSDSE